MSEEKYLTFEADNKLGNGRKEYAERLTEGLSKFYPLADGAYVLSLNAPFGAGKTHFLNMWKSYLQNESYQVISINAWETDFAENPAIPIISALVEGISEEKSSTKKQLKDALHTAIAASAMIGNQLLSHATGIDGKAVMEEVESEKEGKDLIKAGERLYNRFVYQKKAFQELRGALSDFVASLPIQGKKQPLVILVDELDRARPDYAVNFLETIKHLFAVPGIVFVLAVNRQQLEISVRQLFGTDIDFKDYYLRFVTTETNLPEPNQDDLKEYIKSRLQHYFPSHNFAQSQGSLVDYITNLAIVFELKLRTIDAYIRRITQTSLSLDNTATSALQMISLLVAIEFHDTAFYTKICTGKITPADLTNFITSLPLIRLAGSSEKFRQNLLVDIFSGCAAHANYEEIYVRELAKTLTPKCLPDDIRRRMEAKMGDFKLPDSSMSVYQHVYDSLQHWKELPVWSSS